MQSIQVVPQNSINPTHFIGGRYIRTEDGADVTNQTFALASIDVRSGKGVLKVKGIKLEVPTKADGKIIRTNLIRRSAGWTWLEQPSGLNPISLCTVETGNRHYYALQIWFRDGVTLSRYPLAKSEPRLRPTTYGMIDFEDRVGEILLRGRRHDVFWSINVSSRQTPDTAAPI